MCRGRMCTPPCSAVSPAATETTSTTSSRSKAWLKRSLASRTQSFVDAEVDRLLQTCRFLQQHQHNDHAESSSVAQMEKTDVSISDEPLGSGSFSQVHAVQSIDMDPFDMGTTRSELASSVNCGMEKVVLKHLKDELLQNRRKLHSAAADLVLEGKLLQALDHENIIRLRGICSSGTEAFASGSASDYFLLLEHVEETLFQRIQSRNNQEEDGAETEESDSSYLESYLPENLHIAQQLASALEYLHERDLIFRDLKPANVGLTQDGTVKLFDFGLCRELPEASPQLDQVFEMSGVGTRRYMAPEILRGEGYNCKADVYSFAICLYELLSGQNAFDLYNHDMHMMLVVEEGQRPAVPEEWPVELQQLLTRAWSENPVDRPTMAEIVQELNALMLQYPSAERGAAAENATATAASTSARSRSNSPLRRMLRLFAAPRQAMMASNKKKSSTNKKTLRRCRSTEPTILSTTLVD